jgi:hypothetical protein
VDHLWPVPVGTGHWWSQQASGEPGLNA